MSWDQIREMAKVNQAYASQWKIRLAECCPDCGVRVERDMSGKRGCTFCGWTERR